MCGVWCVVCGVWCVVCGVWCVVCGVWCVVCGVWCVVSVAHLARPVFVAGLGGRIGVAEHGGAPGVRAMHIHGSDVRIWRHYLNFAITK